MKAKSSSLLLAAVVVPLLAGLFYLMRPPRDGVDDPGRPPQTNVGEGRSKPSKPAGVSPRDYRARAREMDRRGRKSGTGAIASTDEPPVDQDKVLKEIQAIMPGAYAASESTPIEEVMGMRPTVPGEGPKMETREITEQEAREAVDSMKIRDLPGGDFEMTPEGLKPVPPEAGDDKPKIPAPDEWVSDREVAANPPAGDQIAAPAGWEAREAFANLATENL